MAQPIHVIRLRGPWQYELASNGTDSGDSVNGKITLPADIRSLIPSQFSGKIKLTRRFHAPTNLSTGEQVWFTFINSHVNAEIYLNGKTIGQLHPSNESLALDATDNLHSPDILSLLSVEFDFPLASISENCSNFPFDEACLEIRS